MTDRTPLTQVEDKTPEPTKEENQSLQEQSTPPELMGLPENIEYQRVAEFLGVDYTERQDPVLAEKIDFIYKWGQTEAGSEDRLKSLVAIQNLIKGLGITDKGKNMVKKVYKWMRLDTSRKRIEQEMSLLT
jgi:hypothetical protein